MGFSLCSKGRHHFVPALALWLEPGPGCLGRMGRWAGGRADGRMDE